MPDTTPPSFFSADAFGGFVTVTFDEALDPSAVPDAADFTVRVDGSVVGVSAVTLGDFTAVLAIVTPVLPDQTVAVSYAPGAHAHLRDVVLNEVVAFGPSAATNSTLDVPVVVPPPPVAPHGAGPVRFGLHPKVGLYPGHDPAYDSVPPRRTIHYPGLSSDRWPGRSLYTFVASRRAVFPTVGTFLNAMVSLIPASHWRFGEAAGTNADDHTAANHDGTYLGGFTLAQAGALAGDTDKAISLDGLTGRVDFGDVYDFNGTAPFSLVAIVRPNTVDATNRRIFSKLSSGGYEVYHSSGGLKVIRDDGTGSDELVGSAALTASVYQLVVATYDGANLRLYKDKTLLGTLASTRSIPNTAGALIIGNRTALDRGYDGRVDEPAVFSRALAKREVDFLVDSISSLALGMPLFPGAGTFIGGARNLVRTSLIGGAGRFLTKVILHRKRTSVLQGAGVLSNAPLASSAPRTTLSEIVDLESPDLVVDLAQHDGVVDLEQISETVSV